MILFFWNFISSSFPVFLEAFSASRASCSTYFWNLSLSSLKEFLASTSFSFSVTMNSFSFSVSSFLITNRDFEEEEVA